MERTKTVDVLNQALATEIVCCLRLGRCITWPAAFEARDAERVPPHANEEQVHADLRERIAQLGGTPNQNPEGLATRSHSEYHVGGNLKEMLTEDLVAERIAIRSTRRSCVGWARATPRHAALWRRCSRRRKNTPTTSPSS